MQNIDFENLKNVRCEHCKCILDSDYPIFSRIVAKYLGFCYECIHSYGHNSLFEQEKIKLANLIQELQNAGEEQVASFYHTLTTDNTGLARLAVGFQLLQQAQFIEASLIKWNKTYENLDNILIKPTGFRNEFFFEGFEFGRYFHLLAMRMRPRLDFLKATEQIKFKLGEILTQGSHMIGSTTDLLEKRRIYCVVFGIFNNIYGVTKGIDKAISN